jgi:hypothetical protein
MLDWGSALEVVVVVLGAVVWWREWRCGRPWGLEVDGCRMWWVGGWFDGGVRCRKAVGDDQRVKLNSGCRR